MKIEDLITALQPLVGWHIYIFSDKRSDVVPCRVARELREHEQQHERDVILATGEEGDHDFPPGITLLARNVVRVDWVGDRAWIEAKGRQLGYIQRVKPIETTEPSEGAQDAV